MSADEQRMGDIAVHAMEVMNRAKRSLQEISAKQEELKRRVAAVEYRIGFLLRVIQDTKAKWKVK